MPGTICVCVRLNPRYHDPEIVSMLLFHSLAMSARTNTQIAFMLFRQHQQSSIMAQNPGLPIPDVSKIIGEQWRRLSAEAKEEWNLLAEVS